MNTPRQTMPHAPMRRTDSPSTTHSEPTRYFRAQTGNTGFRHVNIRLFTRKRPCLRVDCPIEPRSHPMNRFCLRTWSLLTETTLYHYFGLNLEMHPLAMSALLTKD